MQVPRKQRTPQIAERVRQRMPPSQGDASQSCLELQLPDRANGGRRAAPDPGGDRRVHSRVLGDRGDGVVHDPGRDHDQAPLCHQRCTGAFAER